MRIFIMTDMEGVAGIIHSKDSCVPGGVDCRKTDYINDK